MDIATVIGLLGAFGLILFAIGPANLGAFIDVTSILIVIGGTLFATFAANPLEKVIGGISVYLKSILVDANAPHELIEKIVGFAETARREGILALESAAADAGDPFLSGGIQLAVDGTEPDLIMDILETELQYLEERHSEYAGFFDKIAEMAPAFGMIGTLVGLVLMLLDMSDPAAIGPAMATALLTTLYGAVIANVIFTPIAFKLKNYSKAEILNKRMIIEGIMAIQQGDNPRIVERKLSVFLSPSMRGATEEGS